MLHIGKWNTLKITKISISGIVLDGQEHGELVLSAKEAPRHLKVDGEVAVFIYLNSKEKIVATTKKPYATVGQFAHLKVISVNAVGAFLDWGLPKDLLAPFREQTKPMKEGRSYIVFIYFDETSKRIAASSKLNKFLDKKPFDYQEGQEVDLLICFETDLGYKAIINNMHWGALYKNEVFQSIQNGQMIKGFIKKVREDGKLDLTLHKPGYTKVTTLTKRILDLLKKEGGYIAISDKSSPQLIYELFGESKSTFKNAIGALYKKRLITIEKNGIKLA